jgi:hypothetical protein
MRRHVFNITLLALTLMAVPAIAQDLVALVPKDVKVEYEDARVRVVRLKIAPHEKFPMHDRPARVVIGLTPDNVRLTTPDGKEHTVNVPAGDIQWSAPGRRSVTNLDQPVENVIVEMKDYTEPAKKVAEPPAKNDPKALIDRYHHWLFENQYVRVYDVRIPPGGTTEFHTHAYDSVFVQLSPGFNSEQVQGKGWSKPEKSEAGEASYSPDASKPRTHRVRNDSDHEFRVVIVQLMK